MNLLENQWIHLQESEKCRIQDEKQPENQIFEKLYRELERKKDELSKMRQQKIDLQESKRGLSNAWFYFSGFFCALIIVIFFGDPSNLDFTRTLLGYQVPREIAPPTPVTDYHFTIYQKLRDYHIRNFTSPFDLMNDTISLIDHLTEGLPQVEAKSRSPKAALAQFH